MFLILKPPLQRSSGVSERRHLQWTVCEWAHAWVRWNCSYFEEKITRRSGVMRIPTEEKLITGNWAHGELEGTAQIT